MNDAVNEVINEAEAQSAEVREVRLTPGISPKEVEALLDMAGTSGLFTEEALMHIEDMAYNCAYQNDEDACRFVMAKTMDDGVERPIGFLCFGSIPGWPEDSEIFGIAVTPEFQRLGIGSAMLEEMQQILAANGGRQIFVEVDVHNGPEETTLFYEANGYAQELRFQKQFIPKEGNEVYRYEIGSDENQSNH